MCSSKSRLPPALPPLIMYRPLRKWHPVLKPLNGALIDLPASFNLSIWWNFGSLLGLCLVIQIITGIFLAIFYTPHADLAFSSISHIIRDVTYGWALRRVHANGASIFFVCLYLHIARGIYYGSFKLIETWITGVIILILSIATAFLGYVLPWGQIRFWGATVITNLLSAIPYIGKSVVLWLWGGFAVGNPTLNRFFALHFLLPFIIAAVVVIHLLYLHQTGSNNPLGITRSPYKIHFHWLYTIKDLTGFIFVIYILLLLCLYTPFWLGDPENFLPANPLMAPIHIIPEWYFLWAYAILRSIPNKLGGVVAIFAAILILFRLPLINHNKRQGLTSYFLAQILFWSFGTTTILLTWIGGCPVEPPYIFLGQIFTTFYFSFYFLLPLTTFISDEVIDHP